MEPIALEKAIRINQAEQKKRKKKTYTKPDLFLRIESFIRDKKLIGYGGTAINRALPREAQFYRASDIPDYDFFSTQAVQDARELADLLYPFYPNVEVKPAMFPGTYKLFVNFLPLVDFTQIEKELFHNMFVTSFAHDGIHYVPYNYLRMSMYQELSRPLGDLTRWTKVYERLNLLNTYHPFLIRNCDVRPTLKAPSAIVKAVNKQLHSYVCLGDHIMYYWQELFPEKYRYPQQDVLFILSETIEEIWEKLSTFATRFTYYENKLIKVYEVYVENHPILYVILTDACSNYTMYKKRKIATYDTTLSTYYALSFANIKHLSKPKLLSYCYLLLQITEEHPLMKRFQLPCYGTQITMEEIRKKRDEQYKRKHTHFHYRPRSKKLTVKHHRSRSIK
jgi:hypothetical protein